MAYRRSSGTRKGTRSRAGYRTARRSYARKSSARRTPARRKSSGKRQSGVHTIRVVMEMPQGAQSSAMLPTVKPGRNTRRSRF